MTEAGVAGDVVFAQKDPREGWSIHWREDRTWRVRDCLLMFGISGSKEEALAKVESALASGIAAPPMSAAAFRKKFAGGVFYPVDVVNAIPVARNVR